MSRARHRRIAKRADAALPVYRKFQRDDRGIVGPLAARRPISEVEPLSSQGQHRVKVESHSELNVYHALIA